MMASAIDLSDAQVKFLNELYIQATNRKDGGVLTLALITDLEIFLTEGHPQRYDGITSESLANFCDKFVRLADMCYDQDLALYYREVVQKVKSAFDMH